MKKRRSQPAPVVAAPKQTYNVIAKIRHTDGDIEPRRLYLEGFTRFGDAAMAAHQAKKDPLVLAAWVESAQG